MIISTFEVTQSPENTTYYWVNKELLSKKNPDGSRYYYQNDHLGSSSLLTNSSGGIAEQTKYDPWGKVKVGGTKSKFQYTGQEKDAETGLNYYNARYYDSHIRRFTQPDTIIQNVYNPQDLNKYAYVRNNPLKYTDPSGNVTCNANGCSSDYSALRPQPKKQAPPALSKAMPYYAPVYNNNSNASKGSNTALPPINATYSPPLLQPLPEKEKGYYNANASSPIVGVWGVSTGLKIDTGGYAPYLNTGFVGKQPGVSGTYSNSGIEENSASIELSYFKGGKGGSASLPIDGGELPSLEDADLEAGYSTAEGGAVVVGYTFAYNEWGGKKIRRK